MEDPKLGEVKPSRRSFLKRAAKYSLSAAGLGLGYTVLETSWLGVRRETIEVPRLPAAFAGTTIALIADIHHGVPNRLTYVQRVVRLANSLQPDIVVLGGDSVHRHRSYVAPCFAALGNLRSQQYGVCGVLGNHDHWSGAGAVRAAMADSGIVELSNRGFWIEKDDQRLRIAGVDDLWEGNQFLNHALADTQDHEVAILLSHNPDYTELVDDPRVGLVLSGHTHGGQVVLPLVGAPRVPSSYGQKYLQGLVKTDVTQVYVTRGVGSIGPMDLPVRFCCPPEISLLTIVPAPQGSS